MPAVFLLCCSLLLGFYPATLSYRVVVSSSPQSPVPYTAGSVQLSCSITPLPPGPVTYSWTAVPNAFYTYNPSSSNSSLPIATANIGYRTARHPTYYCHVRSNGNKVATGKITLTIQGFLQYVSPPVAVFSPGDNVTLEFNISNHYYAASSIKTTQWYYNGQCIDYYSYDHYILDLNNTRLTILNASESDVGQYEVRVTELNLQNDPPKCDSMTLDLLQHNAFYAPVIYCLTLNEENNLSCLDKIAPKLKALYGTVNQTLSVTEKHKIAATYWRIYSEGILASYLDDAGQPFYGTNGSHLLINIPLYNQSWAGEYSVVLYGDCYDNFQGCSYSRDLVCYDLFFFIHFFLGSVLQVTVATFEFPVLDIQAYKVVQRGGSVTLNCSVEGGNPMDYTVQWMKDGQQLASTTSVPAVLLYTSPHYQQQFGVFTCSAINQYYHINKTVLIQERDSFQGLWVFSKPDKMLVSNALEMQNTLININNVVINAMNSISVSWSLVDNHFHNCSLHLTSLAGGLYYRCDLVYSDPSGVNTASTILTSTQEWLMDNNISITINSAKLELSKLCMFRLDDSSMATCFSVIEQLADTTCNTWPSISPVTTPGCPVLSETADNSAGAITGGFIGGLLLGILTCAAGIGVILFCRFLLHVTRKNTNTDGQDGIELNVNTAYNTVKYGQSPFQQKPHEPDTSQNPYENWVMT